MNFAGVHAGNDRTLAAINPLIQAALVMPSRPTLVRFVGIQVPIVTPIEHIDFWQFVVMGRNAKSAHLITKRKTGK